MRLTRRFSGLAKKAPASGLCSRQVDEITFPLKNEVKKYC
jgi:hypothetical protein